MKKQNKIILYIILCIVVIGLAVLIWANTTGRVSIWANPIAPPVVQTGPVQGYPICKSVTVSNAVAGWYDSSTGGLIKQDSLCSGYSAQCLSQGSRSEGWYKVKNDFIQLIKYDNCADNPQPTSTPTASPTSSSVTKSCVDSDGGIVPSVFGTVTTNNGTLTDTQSDRCVDNGAALEEAYCESSTSSVVGFRKIYQTCQNGVVVSTPSSSPTTNCVDECVSPSLVCTSSTSYQVCGNYDSDSCLEYQNNTCTEDKICQNNTIITKPVTTATATSTADPTQVPIAQIPDIPTNLQATNITDSSVKLTWDSVSTAVSYGIYNAQAVAWVSTSDTNSYTISGLKCATNYSFQVTAVNEEGYGSNPTEPVSFTTGACQDITTDISTQKPENVQIESNGISVTISWDSMDNASGYDIYDCSGNYIISTDNIDNASRVSYTFSSSNCGTNYCYYVVAHDASGSDSLSSDQVSANTADCEESTSTTSITSLVSTGASLWFNLLIAILIMIGAGYFMFRSDIYKK